MKIFKFTPLFIMLFPCFVISQSDLKGSIIDEKNNPVAFANVILLNAEDSTSVYKGTVSEADGSFILNDLKENNYLLKVTFVGYREELQRIYVEGDIRLQPITLKTSSSALEEVTLNARKPRITRQVDRIVFDVENSILSTGNTYEILKKTPGVIVSQGQLLVRNRAATVYINSRKVYLTSQELQQLLEGFSAGNVKSVEVITNPPARYDAEGGAILNITTSKNISIGYKGSLNASNTVAVVPKYNIGTSQYYKNDWLNFFASYNLNTRDDYKRDEGFIEFYAPDGSAASNWLTDFERNTETTSHSLNTIFDFSLSESSQLSLSANILHTPTADSDITGQTDIYGNQGLDSLFTTNSRLENEKDNILLSASFNTALGNKGATLAAVANYIDYEDTQTQNLMTEYFAEEGAFLRDNSFFTRADQASEIYTGRIDISSPWGNTNLETGVKISGLESQSGLDFFDTNTGGREFVDELSDDFNYKESIYAAFFSFSRDWEKWSLKSGLRGEYTDVQGNSASLGTVNTQEYFELFPTFYLMHTINDNNAISLDYSRRIVRPRFESLNTYRYFLNENNFQEGNPNLAPAISNKINFNYTYKNKLSFDLYWDRGDNAIATLPFQDNVQRNLRSVSLNMDYEQQYSLDISFYDYIEDWWYLSAYSSVFYMQNDFPALESDARIVTNDVFSTYLQAYNLFTLSKDGTFTGEVIGSFTPDFISGSYQFEEAQYGLDLGLRKTFFDNKLVATVNAQDIFNTMNIPLRSQYLNQNNGYFAMPESRSIRFGLIYKFGNFKLRDNNRAVDAEESERLKDVGNM